MFRMLPNYTTLERPKLGTNCHTIIMLSANGPRHCCLIGTWHCITLLLQSKVPIITASPLHSILHLDYSTGILALPSCISHFQCIGGGSVLPLPSWHTLKATSPSLGEGVACFFLSYFWFAVCGKRVAWIQ